MHNKPGRISVIFAEEPSRNFPKTGVPQESRFPGFSTETHEAPYKLRKDYGQSSQNIFLFLPYMETKLRFPENGKKFVQPTEMSKSKFRKTPCFFQHLPKTTGVWHKAAEYFFFFSDIYAEKCQLPIFSGEICHLFFGAETRFLFFRGRIWQSAARVLPSNGGATA